MKRVLTYLFTFSLLVTGFGAQVAAEEPSEREKEIEARIQVLTDENDAILKTDADKNIAACYTDWQNAVKKYNNKAKDVESLKRSLDIAMADYNKGSFGFFEYVNAKEALLALNTGDPYISKGIPGDATDLESMKQSISFIKKRNESREVPLLVSDYLMACAQAEADFRLEDRNSLQLFELSENTSGDVEIVSKDFTHTGYAVACKDKSESQYVETFLKSDDTVFTVEEYEQRFMNYYNMVTTEMNRLKPIYDKALTELESLKEAAETCEGLYNEALEAKDNNAKILEKNRAEISELKKELASIRAAELVTEPITEPMTEAESTEVEQTTREAASTGTETTAASTSKSETAEATTEEITLSLSEASKENKEKKSNMPLIGALSMSVIVVMAIVVIIGKNKKNR